MKINLLVSLYLIFRMTTVNAQQYAWVQRSSFSAGPRYSATYFTIGNKGYLCSGITHIASTLTYYTDFWEYDPGTDVWTQKANFPADGRSGGSGFAVGGNGYVTCGWIPSQVNDLWQYNPGLNLWSQKTNFGGPPRYTASQFVIGNYAYVGTGFTPYLSDFWQYDFQIDAWTQVADIGGAPRQAARGFALNGYGYVVTGGQEFVTYSKDLWRYDSGSNLWTQMTDFPGAVRSSPIAFTMNGKAFVGCGADDVNLYNDFYSYDPVTDVWSSVPSFAGLGRLEQISFSFTNRGYAGTGSDNYYFGGNDLSELWELVDVTGIDETASPAFSVTPTVSDGSVIFNFTNAPDENYIVSVFDVSGKVVVKQNFMKKGLRTSVSLPDATKGIYIYTITTVSNKIKAGKINF